MSHHVKFATPVRDLGKSDVKFYVWNSQDRIGTLKISKGTAVWFPKNKKWGHKVSWAKLGQLFEENGTRWEKR